MSAPPASSGDFKTRAFEKYVLELVVEGAKEEERLWLEAHESEMYALIRQVELSGDYPDTVLRLLVSSPGTGKEHWHTSALWRNSMFFDESGAARLSAPEIAGYILMWARGG